MWTPQVVYALPKDGVAGAFQMDIETWNGLGLPLAQDIVLCYVTLALVYFLTSGLGRSHDRWALTHELWWYPFSFVLVYYAAVGSFKLRAPVEARWKGTCDEAQTFMRLYVAAQVLAVPIELLCEGPLSAKVPMLAHHCVSIFGYVVALATRSGHWFCAAAGLSEVSTIFLEGVLLAKRAEVAAFVDAYAPWFLTLNGAMLWLTYVVFRLVLFPALLAVFLYDKFRLKHPVTTYDQSPEACIIVPLAVTFLFLLSLTWFAKIHKGFMTKVVAALVDGHQKHHHHPHHHGRKEQENCDQRTAPPHHDNGDDNNNSQHHKKKLN
mmetsp:Transcript_25190/g.81441  ORF Transcript_25190/g.81441 Transcript_25190/m.81441 type:complete len:322 (+) Transcript_25190:142-1107(+)